MMTIFATHVINHVMNRRLIINHNSEKINALNDEKKQAQIKLKELLGLLFFNYNYEFF